MSRTWRRPLAFGSVAMSLALALLGCSGDKPKPTPLETLTATNFGARSLWTTKLDRINFPLMPAVADNAAVVASSDGTVTMLDGATGREAWRVNVGAPIVAGVGFDGTRSAVVTRANELVVLTKDAVLWRKPLTAQVTSAPLVAGERVFVLGVDRAVHAFDALSGDALWSMPRPAGDALGLVSAGVVAAYKNTLLVGQGPRLAGVDPLRGSANFEVPVASPRGTNEVERLADLVGPPVRLGDVMCVRSFQSAVGCVNVERGALVWSKNVSGSGAVGGDSQLLVGADASDRVLAWRTTNGETVWSHERLRHRGLSGAAVLPKAIVMGDSQGFLHVFDRATGDTLQRLPTDGSPVVGTPVMVGSTLLVVNRNGAVHGIAVD